MESLNQYLNRQDDNDAEECAIELLAEQLIRVAIEQAGQVLMASNYNVTASDRHAVMGDAEFYELYYAIAENLIKKDRGNGQYN